MSASKIRLQIPTTKIMKLMWNFQLNQSLIGKVEAKKLIKNKNVLSIKMPKI